MNGLAINVQKTNIICFRPHANFDKTEIVLDGKKELKTCKLLGVLFDRKYDFSAHVSRVKFSVNDKLRKLQKVRDWMNFKTRKEVYPSICKSIIEYCLDIYARNESSRKILQVLCNRIYRDILIKTRYEPIINLHNDLDVLSVNNMYRYQLVTNLLNLLKWESSLFTFRQLDLEEKVYKTRNRFLNVRIVPKKENVKSSWIIRSTDSWNALQCFKIQFVKPELYKDELKGSIKATYPNIVNDKIV